MFGAMTATDSWRWPRSFISRFRRGLKLTPVAVAAWLSEPTISAAGAIIDYGFSNDASAVLAGQPVSISGLVGLVPAVGEVFAQIQLTGLSPFAGLYTVPAGELLPVPPGTFFAGGTIGNLTIGYANDLSLTSVAITRGSGTVSATAVTGTAVVVGSSVTYTFSPGSSVVINGVSEAISGFFDFDPLTHIEWESEIQLTGPAPYAGNCFSSTQLVGARFIDTNCPQLGTFFQTQFFFANDLSSTAAAPLALVSFPGLDITDATGFALPGVPVPMPEPTSLALLSAALGLAFPFVGKASHRSRS
jgi:hypothetical protein